MPSPRDEVLQCTCHLDVEPESAAERPSQRLTRYLRHALPLVLLIFRPDHWYVPMASSTWIWSDARIRNAWPEPGPYLRYLHSSQICSLPTPLSLTSFSICGLRDRFSPSSECALGVTVICTSQHVQCGTCSCQGTQDAPRVLSHSLRNHFTPLLGQRVNRRMRKAARPKVVLVG